MKKPVTFGSIVLKHLAASGWKRADLARATRYSPSYITNITNDLKPPSAEAVRRIVEALEIPENVSVTMGQLAAELNGFKVRRTKP